MKWIEDLPADFTQDFRFTVTGVEDPMAWFNKNLGLAQRDWDSVVSLTRDEMVKVPLIANSILFDDLGEAAVEFSFWTAHVLDDDTQSKECCIVGDLIRHISFAGNRLTHIPDLSGINGLISLDLSLCEALHDVSALSGLPGLTSLNLSRCKSLQDVSALSGLAGLTSLDLTGVKSLQDVSVLTGLTSLTWLNLSKCVYLQDISGLTALTSLTSLDLSECRSLQDVSGLMGLASLTWLNLSWCDLLQDVSALSGLTGLTSLDLTFCKSLQDVSVLSGLKSLTSLNLSRCPNLQDISGLMGLTSLTSLNLTGCPNLKDISGLMGLTILASLKLSGCKFLQDVSALPGLTGLTSLDLSGCRSLKDISGLMGLTSLTSLNLSSCPNLKDISSLKGLKNLTSLKLSWCKSLQDISSLKGLTSLTSLDLTSCPNLKDISGLMGLTILASLKLSGCKFLQDVSALSDLTNLTSLDLDGCLLLDQPFAHQSLRKMTSLSELKGIREPVRTEILLTTARRRGDFEAIVEMLPHVVEFCGNKHFDTQELRRGLLLTLPQMELTQEQWQSLNKRWWSAEEWSLLWRAMLAAKNALASSMLKASLSMAEHVAEAMAELPASGAGADLSAELHGWLLFLAEGGEWPESIEWLTDLVAWLPVSELHSAGPDLLMALRVVGLNEVEQEVLHRLTQGQSERWAEQVEYRLARAAVETGNIGQAIQSIGALPASLADEVRNALIARWAQEMPEEVAEWLSGFHKAVTREQAAIQLASSNSNVATSTARHLVLMDVVPSREALLPFIESMAAALPADPWVEAILNELGSNGSSLSLEVLEAMGLELLRHDEAVREEVGDRKLRKLIEERGQEAQSFREQARQAALDLLRREDLMD